MINHVVLFKMKEFSNSEDKKQAMLQVKDQIENLKNEIKEVKLIEVGLHYDIDSPSYDISLISHFNSIEDLDIYRVHPEHKKVVDFINEVTESRAAVDYKF